MASQLECQRAGLLSFTHAKLWAVQEIAASLLLYFSKQEFIKCHIPIFIAIAIVVISAATFKRAKLLQAAVLASSLVRAIMTLQLSYRTEVPNLLRYADLPTYFLTVLHEMLMLDFKFTSFLIFIVSHAGLCAYFYYKTNVHRILMSISQAFGIHAVCFFVYLAIRRNANRMHAPEVQSDTPSKSGVQRQSKAHGSQQGGERHRLHQHGQNDKKPGMAQQQQQQQEQQGGAAGRGMDQQKKEATGRDMDKQQKEAAGRDMYKQRTDGVTAGVLGLQINKPQGYAGMRTAPGIAPVAAAEGRRGPISSISPSPRTIKPTHQHAHSTPKAMTLDPKAVVDALRASSPNSARTQLLSYARGRAPDRKAFVDALAQRGTANRKAYVFKLPLPHSSHPDIDVQRYIQAACRMAVKVNSPSLPDSVRGGTLANLSDRLRRYQCLMPAECLSVRAGCLIISYGAVPFNQGCTLQEMRQQTLAEAKEWALEHGLLSPEEEGLLTVQACRQSSWGSDRALCGLDCLPEHSMHVRQPFIETSPANMEQEEAFCAEQEAFCSFGLSIVAPPHLELRGWGGAADAPEDLKPEAVKCRGLCMLTSVDGEYVKTSVEQQQRTSSGELSVQVQVSLAKNEVMLDAANPHPKVLVLELWAAGQLVCSYSAILLPRLYAGALAELQCWVDGAGSSSAEESSVFVRDVVTFMHIQANYMSALLEGQDGVTAWDGEGSADPQTDPEVPHMLYEVGADLLSHCLQNGMTTLAGMLLDAFTLHPCPHPLSNLLGAASLAEQPETAQLQGVNDGGSPSSAFASAQQLQASSAPESDLACLSSACPQPGIPQPAAAAAAGSARICPTLPALSSSTPHLAPPAASITACRDELASRSAVASASQDTTSESTASEEGLYQAWKTLQLASIAKIWCWIQTMLVGLTALRSWWERGVLLKDVAAVFSEETALTLMVPTYLVGALSIGKSDSSCTELIVAAILAVRACVCVLLGLRTAPIPVMLLPVLRWRVEVLIELMIMPIVELVPKLSWLLPLRLVHTFGVGLWYSRAGFVAPFFQAIALNACSLAVSKVIDTRYRRLHALTLANAKQSKADGSDLQQEAPSNSHEQVLLPRASLSTAQKCKLV